MPPRAVCTEKALKNCTVLCRCRIEVFISMQVLRPQLKEIILIFKKYIESVGVSSQEN